MASPRRAFSLLAGRQLREARRLRCRTYEGAPCRHCGDTERFTCNRCCVVCHLERVGRTNRLLSAAAARAGLSQRGFYRALKEAP